MFQIPVCLRNLVVWLFSVPDCAKLLEKPAAIRTQGQSQWVLRKSSWAALNHDKLTPTWRVSGHWVFKFGEQNTDRPQIQTLRSCPGSRKCCGKFGLLVTGWPSCFTGGALWGRMPTQALFFSRFRCFSFFPFCRIAWSPCSIPISRIPSSFCLPLSERQVSESTQSGERETLDHNQAVSSVVH